MPYRTIAYSIVPLPLLLLSFHSLAQGEKPHFETVTITASRNEQILDQITSSLSVISEEDLRIVSAVHSNDVLTRVPGTWISRGNGQEHLTAIRSPVLTGAGSCAEFYISEDGVPVRSTGFCNVNQLFDINTEQAQQIEVLRGPGTVLHGSGALHGVINVISKPPSEDLTQQVQFDAGPHDYSRLKYSISNSLEKHSFRISINGAHDGGYKDNSGFDQQKLSARYDYTSDTINIKTLLSFSNLNQETASYVEGLNAYKDNTRKKENPNPEAYRESQSLRVQTRLEKDLGDNRYLIVTPYIRQTEMDFLMHFLPGTPKERNGHKGLGIQTSYHQILSPKLSLTNGFDAEYTQAYLEQTQKTQFSSFPKGKQYDYDVTASVLAAFIKSDYELTPHTNITTGIRYEFLDYDYDNRMISGNTAEDGTVCTNTFTNKVGCRYSRPEDSNDSFDNWSLSAGIIHRLNDNISIAGRLAHGFRSPQASELYRLQGDQTTTNIDSVELDSIEFSLRGKLDLPSTKQVTYSISSYFMKKNNVIFQSSERLNLSDGQTEHYGLEYQMSIPINDVINLNLAGSNSRHLYTKDVNLFGSATSIDINNNDIDTAPRHIGSAQLAWSITPYTHAELEWVHMGGYFTDIDNLHRYDGHDLINLRVKKKFNSQISAAFQITNITDENYAERADYSSFSGDRYFIGEPRSVFVNISLTF